jgi:hypothetical protein
MDGLQEVFNFKVKFMKIKNLFLTLLVLIIPSLVFAQTTEIVYLSGTDAANTVDWEFFCTDGRNSGEWKTIPVPSNWELQGFGTYNYGHDWRDKTKSWAKNMVCTNTGLKSLATGKGKP